MFSSQTVYVLRPLQLGVGGKTQGASSAQIEFDALIGLKVLQSGLALLLL